MRFYLAAALALAAAFCLQEFLPAVGWASSARLYLVHTVLFAVAMAVPFPAMLAFAFAGGLVWDARYHLPILTEGLDAGVIAHTELPFGFTILVFGLCGALIQGVRPLFRRGRWGLPILMIGLCISGGLLFEYLVISFHRGGLHFPAELWWKLLMSGLFSALVSPLLLLWLSRLADRARFPIRIERKKRRHLYDGDAL